MAEKKTRLAVLLSGGGTTFQFIQDRITEGALDAETVVVIGSRADAFGLERAKKPSDTAGKLQVKRWPFTLMM